MSDEPYRFLAYDGAVVPPILPLSPFTLVLGSFSKSLSLAGERIGWGTGAAPLVDTLNRIRGPFNISATGQTMALALEPSGRG